MIGTHVTSKPKFEFVGRDPIFMYCPQFRLKGVLKAYDTKLAAVISTRNQFISEKMKTRKMT